MKKHLHLNWTFFSLVSIAVVALTPGLVRAVAPPVVTHITIDNTLPGVNRSLPGTVHDPKTGGTIHPINQNNGKASGNNLFYSFGKFDIGSGDTAHFNLTQNWNNVVARVTGGMASLIDGTLRVSGTRLVDGETSHKADYIDGITGATTIANGAKNFFFINPAGIVFGNGSVVDVPGSFYASTASSIKFKDGSTFGFDQHGDPINQLTTSVPAAFGFLGNETGKLTLDHATIQVFNDETLALVGRDVKINSSTVGQVDLSKPRTGYDASGRPDPNADPRFVTKGNLFIDGIQLLLLANHGKRDVAIFNNDPDVPNRSALNAAIAKALKLDGTISVSNTDLINAGGDAEEITFIRGGNINVNNASIVSSNYGDDCAGICADNGGDEPTPAISGIDILATGKLTLNNGHIVTETSFSRVNPAADNVAINIQAASMLMDKGSTVSTKSLNVANINKKFIPDGIFPVPHALDPQAGNINIKVVDTKGVYRDFTARGGSSVESSTETFGNAGKITIDAGSITLQNASIKSESISTTNGLTGYVISKDGDIQRAQDEFGSNNYGRTTSYSLLTENHSRYDLLSHDVQHPNLDAPFDPNNPAFTTSSVRPGLVPLTSPILLIDHNKDAGAAGSVSLTAHNGNIALTNSTISTNILSGTKNTESAKINLTADSGSINMDRSTISSTTSGDANAGDVNLTALHGSLRMSNGAIITTDTNSSGSAGTVTVKADNVSIRGKAPIPIDRLGRYMEQNFTGIRSIAGAKSGGQNGTINISATGDVNMANGVQVSISNLAKVAKTRDLKQTEIKINAHSVYLTDSQIVADSAGNVDASTINITFKDWLKLDPSAISTIAFNGNGGAIKIIGGKFFWLQNSEITTSVRGRSGGNGGNIDIASNLLVMDSGFIQANTQALKRSGGRVNVNVGNLIPSGSSISVGGNKEFIFQPYSGMNVIQAVAPDGVNGKTSATNLQLNLSGTLASLIVQSFDPNAISRNLCAIGESSSLAQSGKGGLRRRAKDALISTQSPSTF
ncbi:MAG: filamentous hemagglutinin N-terminal domain-containing protein [Methyloglobulus sp.]|nr:filamentous hemagglutinin N-terminal domain-containing protein [Methyloglobulus sp.]